MKHKTISVLPSSASIICSSFVVPKVATTKLVFHPGKQREPWVLGRTPVLMDIGLTVLVSLPSILASPFNILDLTMFDSNLCKISPITFSSKAPSSSLPESLAPICSIVSA